MLEIITRKSLHLLRLISHLVIISHNNHYAIYDERNRDNLWLLKKDQNQSIFYNLWAHQIENSVEKYHLVFITKRNRQD